MVLKFREKPNKSVAERYIAEGKLWNTGTFCAKARVFIDEFKQYAPEVFAGTTAFVQGAGRYEDVRSDSIDYAVLEKSNNVWVLPVNYVWSDVGNIEVFLSLKKQGSALQDKVMTVNARNNLVDVPNKLVALIGVDDLCVVDTGDVLLITKRSEAESVKKIVQKLEREEECSSL